MTNSRRSRLECQRFRFLRFAFMGKNSVVPFRRRQCPQVRPELVAVPLRLQPRALDQVGAILLPGLFRVVDELDVPRAVWHAVHCDLERMRARLGLKVRRR